METHNPTAHKIWEKYPFFWIFEFPTLSPIVTEKEFGSREVGKKSESPTFRFSIVTGLSVELWDMSESNQSNQSDKSFDKKRGYHDWKSLLCSCIANLMESMLEWVKMPSPSTIQPFLGQDASTSEVSIESRQAIRCAAIFIESVLLNHWNSTKIQDRASAGLHSAAKNRPMSPWGTSITAT